MPTAYPAPDHAALGDLICNTTGRHWRPAHLHFAIETKTAYLLVTHIFVRGSEHIDCDVAFGVRPALIADFAEHSPGVAPDGREMHQPLSHPELRLRPDPPRSLRRRRCAQTQATALWRSWSIFPPNGAAAPDVDRIVRGSPARRTCGEVVLFPMNWRAEALMMDAPTEVTPKQLREPAFEAEFAGEASGPLSSAPAGSPTPALQARLGSPKEGRPATAFLAPARLAPARDQGYAASLPALSEVRYPARPRPAKPSRSIAHVEGSGTTEPTSVKARSGPPPV